MQYHSSFDSQSGWSSGKDVPEYTEQCMVSVQEILDPESGNDKKYISCEDLDY